MSPVEMPDRPQVEGEQVADKTEARVETPRTLSEIIDAQIAMMEEANRRRDEAQEARQAEVNKTASDPDSDPKAVALANDQLEELDREAGSVIATAESRSGQVLAEADEERPRFYTGDPSKGPVLEFIDTDGKLARQFAESAERKANYMPEDVRPGTLEYVYEQTRHELQVAQDNAANHSRESVGPDVITADRETVEQAKLQVELVSGIRNLIAKGPLMTRSQTDLEIQRIYNGSSPEEIKSMRNGDIPVQMLAEVALAMQDEAFTRSQDEDGDIGIYLMGQNYLSEQIQTATELLIARLQTDSPEALSDDHTEEPSTTENSPATTSDSENLAGDQSSASPENTQEQSKVISPEQATINYMNNEKLIQKLAKLTLPFLLKNIPDNKTDQDFQFIADGLEEDILTYQEMPVTEQSAQIVSNLQSLRDVCQSGELSVEEKFNRTYRLLDQLKSQLEDNFSIRIIQSEPGSEYDRNIHSAISVVETDNPELDNIIISGGTGSIMEQYQPRNSRGQLAESPKSMVVQREQVVIYRYKPTPQKAA